MMRRIAHEVKSLAHGKYVIGAFPDREYDGSRSAPSGGRHKTAAKCRQIADKLR
jgi:hypothetical protein